MLLHQSWPQTLSCSRASPSTIWRTCANRRVFLCSARPPPISTLFPYTTLFRSQQRAELARDPWGHLRSRTAARRAGDRKSTRLNSSHRCISYAVFCLKKKTVDSGQLSDEELDVAMATARQRGLAVMAHCGNARL